MNANSLITAALFDFLSPPRQAASGVGASRGGSALAAGRAAAERGSEQEAAPAALQFIAVPRLSIGKIPSSCVRGLWRKGVPPQVFLSRLEKYFSPRRVAVKKKKRKEKL